MRITIELLNIDKKIIPYDYPTKVRETILNAVQKNDPELAKKIHDNNSEIFNFSQLLGRGMATEEGVRLFRAWLYVSSTNPEFIKALGNSVILEPLLKIGDIQFSISNIRKLADFYISNGDKLRLKTLSPIIVMNKTLDRYLYLNDEEFPDSLIYSIKHQYKRTYGSTPEKKNNY